MHNKNYVQSDGLLTSLGDIQDWLMFCLLLKCYIAVIFLKRDMEKRGP